jgi:uncharacterized RDD family membrane protein YckC
MLPDPATAPELFDGVLTRRVLAHLIDLVVIFVISVAITLAGLVLGILTLGVGLALIPIVVPLAILAYYVLTLGSPRRATLGMSMMDLVLTPARGAPLDGVTALLHPALFWLTFWISWPVSLAFALFTPRRQMLHDLVLGTLMLRRSPMVRHWAGVSPVA